MNMCPELILIRHGEVDASWKGICYGAMDVPLSTKGEKQSLQLAQLILRRWTPSSIYHSGLSRTQFLAEAISKACSASVQAREDSRLRERNYGDWQGLTWEEAYASDPKNFHGLIEDPDHYRPPRGETTSEMQHRAISWLKGCTLCKSKGPIMAISHSGPIASLAGHALRLHAMSWTPWTIRTLECLSLTNVATANSIDEYSVERIDFNLLDSTDA